MSGNKLNAFKQTRSPAQTTVFETEQWNLNVTMFAKLGYNIAINKYN